MRQYYPVERSFLQVADTKTKVGWLLGLQDQTDPYTVIHQKRVAQLSRGIAQKLRCPSGIDEEIYWAASLHDIGKIEINPKILKKTGDLTLDEMFIIRQHPITGRKMLLAVGLSEEIATMVFQHHELIDGSGYPQGLQGVSIPLGACIITVADVIDTVAFGRPYRPARGLVVALTEVQTGIGCHYDLLAVDAALRFFGDKIK